MIRRLALAIALLAALPAHAVEIIGNASSWATYAKAAAATGLTLVTATASSDLTVSYY